MDAVNMTPGNADTVVKHPGILYPLMLIAAIAVIVFSVAGIATMMGWVPGALLSGADPARAQPAPASQQARSRMAGTAAACRDCGVVESLRVLEKSASYEIRVRMSDGASRTLYEGTRPALTVGQKVRVTYQGVVAAS